MSMKICNSSLLFFQPLTPKPDIFSQKKNKGDTKLAEFFQKS